jgi:hypothetical protein
MYLTNKYYDDTKIGNCGGCGDHDGWIGFSIPFSAESKVEQNNKKVDPTSNPNVDQASGMLAKKDKSESSSSSNLNWKKTIPPTDVWY